ncbi:hypothetical protein CsSME_00022193 [Camellia sinensis var. sinensis]
MGTKVHCEGYLSGYYSMRDLNLDSSSSNWHLFYGDKTLANGQYYNSFLPRTPTNAYPGGDKDALKQTMLEHEAIFKRQVFELHRLYKIQKDMMDEIKTKELHKHLIPMETSSSSNLFVSQMPSEEAWKWLHKPNFRLGTTHNIIEFHPRMDVTQRIVRYWSPDLRRLGKSCLIFNAQLMSILIQKMRSSPRTIRYLIFQVILPVEIIRLLLRAV